MQGVLWLAGVVLYGQSMARYVQGMGGAGQKMAKYGRIMGRV
ncbi:MAG: hypothetical protein ACOXZ0_05305 [Eubacteriales bacterium]